MLSVWLLGWCSQDGVLRVLSEWHFLGAFPRFILRVHFRWHPERCSWIIIVTMAPKVLLIDNYDSFVYNLVQELGELGSDPVVYRNDEIDIAAIQLLAPDAIVISPGPGRPEEAGISIDTIRGFAGSIPILGVCLGHQAIGVAFGAKVVRAAEVVHGKTSPISYTGTGILEGLPNPFTATRYHSLAIDPSTVPSVLSVDALAPDGTIMAISHNDFPIWGVQFHPESILTKDGPKLLENFLSQVTLRAPAA